MRCRIPHTAPSLHHLTIIYFEFYKTSSMVKFSVITMNSNRTWLSFLLLRTRNSISAESRSYQKDGKSPSNRMEDIWVIKVNFLYRKNWVLFHTKKPKLLSCQPNKTGNITRFYWRQRPISSSIRNVFLSFCLFEHSLLCRTVSLLTRGNPRPCILGFSATYQ